VSVAFLVLEALGFLGALAFVVLYASRGWYMSPIGRNLMAMAATLAGLLGLSLVAALVHVWLWLWLGGMAVLDVVLWWRVWIVWRLGHQ
jgi:hypothetical protein